MLGYDWARLHAALNDLPVALLLAAVLFDLLAAVTRRSTFRQVSFWTLMVGALGGVAAVLSGLQAEEVIPHGGAVHEVMETHELLAFVTLGLFAVLALWRLFRENRMGAAERSLALALTVGGAGVLIATGMYGGRLIFDHAAGISSEVLQAEARQRGEGHRHGEGEAHGEEGGHDHAAPADTGVAAQSSAEHVDPPGTPAHSHQPDTHSHKPGTPEHGH